MFMSTGIIRAVLVTGRVIRRVPLLSHALAPAPYTRDAAAGRASIASGGYANYFCLTLELSALLKLWTGADNPESRDSGSASEIRGEAAGRVEAVESSE